MAEFAPIQAKLLFNTKAGSVGKAAGARLNEVVEHLRRVNILVDAAQVSQADDVTAAAADAVRAGYSLIIACGGDGTIESAANALVDHVRSLVTPGAIHSVAVKSNGLYGFDANVWAGMPVRTTTPGSYEVITGYAMDDFAKSKLAATNKELVEERAFVADMIK